VEKEMFVQQSCSSGTVVKLTVIVLYFMFHIVSQIPLPASFPSFLSHTILEKVWRGTYE